MAKKNSHVLSGKLHWAKILGDPVPNYNGDNREWTLDLTPDADSVKKLEELGLSDRIKDKGDERGKFIQLRQREKRLDGSLNRKPAVVDEDGKPWPTDKLIGNGTGGDVKVTVRDYGKGKHAGVYPEAIRIRDYKEYVTQHFAPINEGEKARKPEGHIEGFDDDFPE